MKEIRKTKAEHQHEIKRVFRQIPDFYSVAQQYKTLQKVPFDLHQKKLENLQKPQGTDKFYTTVKLWNTKSFNIKF
jgi:hypothetical protein